MDVSWTSFTCVLLVLVCWCDPGLTRKAAEDYGHWGEWGDWTACNAKCGSGMMKKVREWIPGPDYVPTADDTPYTSSKMLACINPQIPNCPVNGQWSGWTSWSECSKPCGQGVKKSTRVCGWQKFNGKPCEGPKSKNMTCNRDPCPVLPRNFQMSECTEKNYTCASKQMCVHGNQRCDGVVHCHDGSDEMNCPKKSARTGGVKYDLGGGGGSESAMYQLGISTVLTVVITVVNLATHLPIIQSIS